MLRAEGVKLVITGLGTIVLVAVPGALGVPAALLTTQPSWTVPVAPAVKVI
jgi:hypothetical protein